ncbi:hypothetical protein [Hymenobacter elongatus]|uniref:Uncharacterized protein n=1 Tax=Hymenobacter elongatus TaxID=877208 RepID=A0A4Z0PFM2_9BACT|nr:hypothetical protein [Hymenobacter elongatus]TGE13948.1 hypothetical protein E5J99_18320 [Hymenobacter elongatus]
MEQASLAFFQNFYTNVSLYVVPEPQAEDLAEATTPQHAVVVEATRAAPEAAAPGAASTPPVLPAPLPTAVPPAPVPLVAAVRPPAVPTPSPDKLPSLATLNVPPPRPVAAPVPVAAVPLVAPARLPTPPAPPTPVAPAPPARTAPPLSATPYSTLGSNANGLVIIVRMDAVRFQRLPRNLFLNNLLKAIRLVMEDVVLINVESPLPVELATLRQRLAARQVIGFGKNLLDLAIRTTQLYEPVTLVGDAAYLPAAEIELLEEDNSRKKLLWQAMQRMFLS